MCEVLWPAARWRCYNCPTPSCSIHHCCVCNSRSVLTHDSDSTGGSWQTSKVHIAWEINTCMLCHPVLITSLWSLGRTRWPTWNFGLRLERIKGAYYYLTKMELYRSHIEKVQYWTISICDRYNSIYSKSATEQSLRWIPRGHWDGDNQMTKDWKKTWNTWECWRWSGQEWTTHLLENNEK